MKCIPPLKHCHIKWQILTGTGSEAPDIRLQRGQTPERLTFEAAADEEFGISLQSSIIM